MRNVDDPLYTCDMESVILPVLTKTKAIKKKTLGKRKYKARMSGSEGTISDISSKSKCDDYTSSDTIEQLER
jgi:hypothetical protein